MLKLSPCIEMLFNQLDFYDKFEAVKDCGLHAVDMWGYTNRDINKLKDLCERFEITITSAVIDSKDESISSTLNKKKLLYSDPDSLIAFYKACKESLEFAKKLNIPSLIITVGQERIDATRYQQHTNIVKHLKNVAPLFTDYNINCIIEPLNVLCDHKGYFLPSSYEAFSICQEVSCKNIKVLYDIYHQQISEGNLISTITNHINYIGHFHVADVPGRHEVGTGEINYANVFKAINNLDYSGYIGLEYSPTIDSKETIINTINLLNNLPNKDNK